MILYQDPDLLVIDKPPGLAVYPQARSQHPNVAQPLAKDFPELAKLPDWGAVHRLDVETSGLLVFARNPAAYQALREIFSKNKVAKEYTAQVQGLVLKPGRLTVPIAGDPKNSKRVRCFSDPAQARRHHAQEAVTLYQPIASDPKTNTSLLKVRIKTGVRHQIRAHMAFAGHPIVGDKLYGGPVADRLYLQAVSLAFFYPRTGKKMGFRKDPKQTL